MPSVQSSISGKVAIITGASSGIGRGIALDFARHGCRLALTGRNTSNLETTKSKCVEQGLSDDSILLIEADMMKNEDIESIVTKTIEKFSQIDILINNAGTCQVGGFLDLPMEKYHEIMQVNVHSVVYLTKLCVPYLEKTKGNIVNISSMCSVVAYEIIWAYNMTKAALDHFCRSLAMDLGPKGIRVNNVNPSVIRGTRLVIRTGMVDEEGFEAMCEKGIDTHALFRSGEVPDVARVVSFLVSDKAAKTTGATFFIDGGKTKMV